MGDSERKNEKKTQEKQHYNSLSFQNEDIRFKSGVGLWISILCLFGSDHTFTYSMLIVVKIWIRFFSWWNMTNDESGKKTSDGSLGKSHDESIVYFMLRHVCKTMQKHLFNHTYECFYSWKESENCIPICFPPIFLHLSLTIKI